MEVMQIKNRNQKKDSLYFFRVWVTIEGQEGDHFLIAELISFCALDDSIKN